MRGHQLADQIVSLSVAAGLGPGARIPTERQLAVDLGVTRSSVRHALAMLQAQGRISREVGRGTFLREDPRAWLGGAREPDGRERQPGSRDGRPDGGGPASLRELAGAAEAGFAPADVMAVRRLLEPPVMSLVVAWATEADFTEMDRCLAGGERAVSYEEFETWDLALYRAIMAASHCPLLVALYTAIEAARRGQVWGTLKRRNASRERRVEYQRDYAELVAALRARDSARAVEVMRLHLSRVSDHLLGSADPAAAAGANFAGQVGAG